ncbi:MAG: metal ABC transporter substrate-binding protein [Acidimicrobiia bacterium]|nr:metal ABC transporter substrate-binding protein [Acidimicrobiia bacterium]MDH3397977.1 metal ABC transporter substrate-binding protein [Acidimicrobiia bacterium]
MKRFLVLAVVFATVGSACRAPEGGRDDRPLVIATTTILGDIVASTAGDAVQVEVLMPIGADPHDFAPSARQAARLRDATLVVANGVGLEESLLDVIDAAEQDGVEVMRVGELVDPQPFLAGLGAATQGSASSGNDHQGLDPHVWMDPVRMAAAVEAIADRLGTSAGVDVIDSAAAYQTRILDLNVEIVRMIEAVPPDRRKMVTNHFSYGYYADRYGITLLGAVIPASTTGAETSAADFAALVRLLKREEVSVVFGSTTEPTTLADALAEEVGYEVKVVKLPTGSLGEPGSGAETYIDMMRSSTRLIVENL